MMWCEYTYLKKKEKNLKMCMTPLWKCALNTVQWDEQLFPTIVPQQAATIVVKNYADHNDVIKWKHFPHYWPFVWGIHWSPVNSPHKGQWCGTLIFSLICARINWWVNNHEAGDLRRHQAHCDVTVMSCVLKHVWVWGVKSLIRKVSLMISHQGL